MCRVSTSRCSWWIWFVNVFFPSSANFLWKKESFSFDGRWCHVCRCKAEMFQMSQFKKKKKTAIALEKSALSFQPLISSTPTHHRVHLPALSWHTSDGENVQTATNQVCGGLGLVFHLVQSRFQIEHHLLQLVISLLRQTFFFSDLVQFQPQILGVLVWWCSVMQRNVRSVRIKTKAHTNLDRRSILFPWFCYLLKLSSCNLLRRLNVSCCFSCSSCFKAAISSLCAPTGSNLTAASCNCRSKSSTYNHRQNSNRETVWQNYQFGMNGMVCCDFGFVWNMRDLRNEKKLPFSLRLLLCEEHPERLLSDQFDAWQTTPQVPVCLQPPANQKNLKFAQPFPHLWSKHRTTLFHIALSPPWEPRSKHRPTLSNSTFNESNDLLWFDISAFKPRIVSRA